jgi:hypothetical protein
LTELQSVAYDPIADVIFGGAQDNGVSVQTENGTVWKLMTGGDGTAQAVAIMPSVNGAVPEVIRYSLANTVDTLTRWDDNDPTFTKQLQIAAFAKLIDALTNGPNLDNLGVVKNLPFLRPLAVNAVDPNRLLLGAINVYESLNQGGTVKELSEKNAGTFRSGALPEDPTFFETHFTFKLFNQVTALAYGGYKGDQAQADVIYVGRGGKIGVRVPGATQIVYTDIPGAGTITDIALDPKNWEVAVAVDTTHVWLTTNHGGTWQDVSGMLSVLGLRKFFSAEFIRQGDMTAVLVGGIGGVCGLRPSGGRGSGGLKWTQFGAACPTRNQGPRLHAGLYLRRRKLRRRSRHRHAGPGPEDDRRDGEAAATGGHRRARSDISRITAAAGPAEIHLVRDTANPAFLDVFVNDGRSPRRLRRCSRSISRAGPEVKRSSSKFPGSHQRAAASTSSATAARFRHRARPQQGIAEGGAARPCRTWWSESGISVAGDPGALPVRSIPSRQLRHGCGYATSRHLALPALAMRPRNSPTEERRVPGLSLGLNANDGVEFGPVEMRARRRKQTSPSSDRAAPPFAFVRGARGQISLEELASLVDTRSAGRPPGRARRHAAT